MPGEKGDWAGNAGSTLATNIGRGLDNNLINLPTNLKITGRAVPAVGPRRCTHYRFQEQAHRGRSARPL